MSSSFVKDCSDASGCSSSNSNKTVIIIVNNEMGNVSLDGNELQNLLASHGADASQVSVVQMGGNYGNLGNPLLPMGSFDPCALNAALPLNFTVDGYSTIPLEGVTVGGYAELPLDADALRRLESVLETQEAKEILGEPLLDIVNNADQLVEQLENLMPSIDGILVESGKENGNIPKSGYVPRSRRPPPKRRSQRQMDKAEREEVEKILAENQKMLKEEREQLRKAQEEEDELIKEEEEKLRESEEEEKVQEKEEEKVMEKVENSDEETLAEIMKVQREKVPETGKNKGKGKVKKSPPIHPKKMVENGKKIKVKGVKKMPITKVENKDESIEAKKEVKAKGKPTGKKTETQEEVTDAKDKCKVPKVLMKKLSVKVKKLNAKDISTPKENEMELNADPELVNGDESRKSCPNPAVADSTVKGPPPKKENKLPSIIDHNSIPGEEDLPASTKDCQHQAEVTLLPPSVTKENIITKKGSNVILIQKKSEIETGYPNSSLNVQNVSQSVLSKCKSISSQPKLDGVVKEPLNKCGDNNNTLSDDKSEINIKSKNNSNILMPTKNFSGEDPLNNQKEISNNENLRESSVNKGINDSTCNTKLGGSEKSLLGGSEKSFKLNKRKVLKVLTPIEKREVVVLSSVSARMQRENLVKIIPPLNIQIEQHDETPQSKKRSPLKKSPNENKKCSKISFENQLNMGNVADKTKKNLIGNVDNKNPMSTSSRMQSSPVISKSLMNYKIPLKNSAAKQLLNQSTAHTPPDSTFYSGPLTPTTPKSHFNTTNPTFSTPNAISNTLSSPLNFGSNKISADKNKLYNPKQTSVLTTTEPLSNISPNLSKNNFPNFNPQKPIPKKHPKLLNLKANSDNIIIKVTSQNGTNSENKTNTEIIRVSKNVANKSSLGKVNPQTIVNSGQNSNTNTPKMTSKIVNKKPEKLNPSKIRNSADVDNAFSIRRSGRPVKKKTFGDDILFLDDKNALISDEEEGSDQPGENDSEQGEGAHNDKSEGSSDDDDDGADDDSDDSDNERGGNEEDDPERLWCICQKPHNNRFMICCDRCEDWFHGSCVGITKPKGKQMEDEEREWICPNCKKAERAIKGIVSPCKKEQEKNQMMEGSSKNQQDISITKVIPGRKENKSYFPKKFPGRKMPANVEKTEPRVLVYEKSSGIVLSGTSAPTLNILGEWLKGHPTYTTLQPAMMNSILTDPKSGMKRIPLEQFGLTPEKSSIKTNKGTSFQDKIDSAYATAMSSAKREKGRVTKLLEHAEVIKLERNTENVKKSEGKSSKKVSSKSNEKETSKKIPVSLFYKEKNEVTRKHSFDKTEDNISSKKHQKEIKESKKQLLKSPEVIEKIPPKSDSMAVRDSVKKMLFDALDKRRSEAKNEFKSLTIEAIRDLCKEIEERLYLCFNKDVGFKYKSRYRSLIFNIRDTKNSGLFRKILNGAIPPPKLAFMTSEELASKELAEWREREEKKELEAIEKHELERIALGNQYIMKSHKGEIAIDKDEFAGSKSKDTDSSVISLAPDSSKIHQAEVPEDEASTNHRNHIYDPNCKICAAIELKEFTLSSSNKEVTSEKLNAEEKDNKEKEKEKRRNSTGRRESTSSHHSKHKKKEKERRNSSHKYKDKEREKSKERHHERRKSKDKHHDKNRHKDRHSSTDESDKQRSRHKSDRDTHSKESSRESVQKEEELLESEKNTKEDELDSKHHKRHKEMSSPKYDKKEKEYRKRKHSESRSEDRKRRDSDKGHKRTHSESEEKTQHRAHRKESNKENEINISSVRNENDNESVKKTEEKSTSESKVSTSDDVVYLPNYISNNCASLTKDEPTSTVVGSPISAIDIEQEVIDLSPAHSIPFPDDFDDEDEEEERIKSPLPLDKLLPLPDSPPSYSPDRSPSTPPLPIDIEESLLLSPATPPLPDNDDDRLTPPPLSKHGDVPVQMPIWKGIINMPDVAKFSAASFEVSGKALFFTGDVPSVVEVVGRINPDNVWSYIAQMKKSGSKEILVVRFQPSSEEEKVSYIALYSYLSSKKRYGVIGNCEKSVKDFYIVPLASHQPIPQVLLPLDGPGFEECRPHMLIGVIVRTKHRRIYDPLTSSWISIGGEPQTYDNQDEKELSTLQGVDADLEERSYTPPPSLGLERPKKEKKRRKVSSEEDSELSSPSSAIDEPVVSHSHSNKDAGSKQDRESMLAELNRQIEKDRKELSEMQRKVDEKIDRKEGSESSKGSDSPPPSGSDSLGLDTSKISIPSNLHEILNSIKKKEEAIKEKEMEIKRRLSIPFDSSTNSALDESIVPGSKDVDLRLLLPQNRKNVIHNKDEDLRLLSKPPRGHSDVPSIDLDFRARDPRMPTRDHHSGPSTDEELNSSSLSRMTDADLLAKAMEMEGPEVLAKKGFQHEDPRRVHPSHMHPTQPPMVHHLPPPHVMVGPHGGPPMLMGPLIPPEGPIPPNPMYGDPPPPTRPFRPPIPYNMPPGPSGLLSNTIPHSEQFGHGVYGPPSDRDGHGMYGPPNDRDGHGLYGNPSDRDLGAPIHMHGPPEDYDSFPGVPLGGDRRRRVDEWEDRRPPRRHWEERERRRPANWDQGGDRVPDRWEEPRPDPTWQHDRRYPNEAETARKRRWKEDRRPSTRSGGGRWNDTEEREWREREPPKWMGGGDNESRKWRDPKRSKNDRNWHNKDNKREDVRELDY